MQRHKVKRMLHCTLTHLFQLYANKRYDFYLSACRMVLLRAAPRGVGVASQPASSTG